MHKRIAFSYNDLKSYLKHFNRKKESLVQKEFLKFLSKSVFQFKNDNSCFFSTSRGKKLIQIVENEFNANIDFLFSNSNFISKWFHDKEKQINFIDTYNKKLYCVRNNSNIKKVLDINAKMPIDNLTINKNSFTYTQFTGQTVANIINKSTNDELADIVKFLGSMYKKFASYGIFFHINAPFDSIITNTNKFVYFNLNKLNFKESPSNIKYLLSMILSILYKEEYYELKQKYSEKIALNMLIILKKNCYYKLYNYFTNSCDYKLKYNYINMSNIDPVDI
jgi:hypothetical protein